KQDKIDTLTLRLRKIEISLSEIVSNSKVKDLEGNVKYIKLLSEEGKVENNIESVNRTIQTSQDTYQSIQLAFIKALTSKCKAV
ncbi:MAG: hypothetical protein U9P38_00435, partial [Campylobacterota bacterium]|nr:hypothetical protein [Campylobacterota bacterium]